MRDKPDTPDAAGSAFAIPEAGVPFCTAGLGRAFLFARMLEAASMKERLKKHKWQIPLPLLALAVLAAAFWYGGNSPGARGWKPETPSESQGEPAHSE